MKIMYRGLAVLLLLASPVILAAPTMLVPDWPAVYTMMLMAPVLGVLSGEFLFGPRGGMARWSRISFTTLLPSWIGITFSFLVLGVIKEKSFRETLALFLAFCLAFVPSILGGLLSARIARRHSTHYRELEQASFAKAVEGLFSSDKFLTTLRSTLPSGESDHLYGYDYIPYLLHNVDERRQRSSRSAARFLFLTSAMGVIFIVVLVGFGYLLLNEAAAGSARNISQLDRSLTTLNSSLREYSAEAENKSTAALEVLIESPWPSGDPSYNQSNILRAVVEQALDSGAYETLLPALEEYRNQYLENPTIDPAHSDAVKDAIRTLRDTFNHRLALEEKLSSDTKRAENLMDRVEQDLGRSENRIPEMIKRMTLGLIIASFFLAILRYTAGIYNDHQQQVIQAERDDMAIRQFYVALRSAGENSDERALILQEFLRQTRITPGQSIRTTDSDILSKNSELAKELLNALVKKI